MISGRVEQLHILLPVTFRLPAKPDLTVDYVVDTGFTGSLTLPAAAVAALQLPYFEDAPATLADDTQVQLPVHIATIVWEGQEKDVRVLATGKRPLLGTALLDGHELVAQFADRGLVTVEEL